MPGIPKNGGGFPRRITWTFLVGAALACATPARTAITDPLDLVDPFIGVRGRGNCVIGPRMPFGSINPSPDTPRGGTDGYDPRAPIRGFSQLHVSGTGGSGKYGQFLLSPQAGLAVGKASHDSPKAEEVASVGYYAIKLVRYGIKAEVAPSRHAAIYRFTFPATLDAHILLDISHQIPGDVVTTAAGRIEAGEVRLDPDRGAMSGWGRYYGGWDKGSFTVHFAAVFSKQPASHGTWRGERTARGSLAATAGRAERVGGFFGFHTGAGEAILVKIAVSFVSVARAAQFLADEIPEWDLDAVRLSCRDAWREALGAIRIEGGTEDERRVFYTALYHSLLMPCDRTADAPTGWPEGVPYYDDQYCLWDTWRTLYPLLTVIQQSRVAANINCFIERQRRSGAVRDAFIAGREVDLTQGGDSVDNIIADAFTKGVAGVDWARAYEVVQYDAEQRRAPPYRDGDRGWIPAAALRDPPRVSCSKTLEYAYNDFCAAQLALGLGRLEDCERYLRRSHGWGNLWDPYTVSDGFSGFVRPRTVDGRWLASSPTLRRYWFGPYFYESSSWTYSFFAPHAFDRLIALAGGGEAFTARLEHALARGLIDLTNEPSFLAARGFHYAGRPDLTSSWARRIAAGWTTAGYPGDEDSGAMGSWYVFTALGFFPLAGQDVYLLNGPFFPRAAITMEGGRRLAIVAEHASPCNPYVQSATLNGAPLDRAWVRHAELAGGGELRFVMGSHPSDWGRRVPPPPAP